MDEAKLKEKIRKHNQQVDYNRSIFSWIVDIIVCLIAFPYIVVVVYRRGKYNKYMEDF